MQRSVVSQPPQRAAAQRDEAMILARRATELRVGLGVLRRELHAVARQRSHEEAELRSLDTPSRQRARLFATAAICLVAAILIALLRLSS